MVRISIGILIILSEARIEFCVTSGERRYCTSDYAKTFFFSKFWTTIYLLRRHVITFTDSVVCQPWLRTDYLGRAEGVAVFSLPTPRSVLPVWEVFNPLKPELNPICYMLALLGAHHFLHVKLLTLRRLMSYIYGAPILDVSRSHTTTQHSR